MKSWSSEYSVRPPSPPDLAKDVSFAEVQLEVAALGCVDDAPALRSARSCDQLRQAPAVDEYLVAFAAEQHTDRAAGVGREQLAVVGHVDVAEHEDEIVGDFQRLGRVLHEKRAVQAEPDLRRRHHVRVIPVDAGVRHHEVVGEGLARLHRLLRVAGHPVHVDRDSESVPVDGARPRQVVREVHDQPVADLHADHRPRNGPVVGPGLHRSPRRDLDLRHPTLEVHLDDVGIGIAVDRFRHRMPASQPAGCSDCAPAAPGPTVAVATAAASTHSAGIRAHRSALRTPESRPYIVGDRTTGKRPRAVGASERRAEGSLQEACGRLPSKEYSSDGYARSPATGITRRSGRRTTPAGRTA